MNIFDILLINYYNFVKYEFMCINGTIIARIWKMFFLACYILLQGIPTEHNSQPKS